MVRLTTRLFPSIVLACAFASAAAAQERRVAAIDPEGIQRLEAQTGGAARISVSNATGAVRFVRPKGKESGPPGRSVPSQ